ncbi:MAG: tricarballylate utilization 4Fe-4S protein TcuB [Candidatus Binatia bacterium]|nr:tricarballylate utilization 4Fe-4S protein TcuB [Candidatus Binatia bacterium]
MRATPAHTEATRQLTICNACRYCEGLCAVFPAVAQHRVLTPGSLDYLANLCHSCSACYYACQYAPPHPFAVNVPQVLAELRSESCARYAWPRSLAACFHRNGLLVALAVAAAVGCFLAGFVAIHDRAILFAAHTGPGAFYRLLPHSAMVALFGSVFAFAALAMALSVRAFWHATGGGAVTAADLLAGGAAAVTLKYLDGGGGGCGTEERPSDRRRLYHHSTFFGFLLCFASTSLAAILHNGLGWQAPYAWYNPVVLLGVLGGLGLLLGPAGLLHAKKTRDPRLSDSRARGMEVGFLVILLLTSGSGLLLLLLRTTPAMGILLALHLGVVFALFLLFPYGKFVHGLYRYAALVRSAREARLRTQGSEHSNGQQQV